MKAILISETGGPEVLKYIDTPKPKPEAGHVLVKAHTIGIGKYDYLVRSGKYPFPVELPVVPGIEMTGVVEAVGPGVSDIEVGQRVQVWKFDRGCYAEYVSCPLHELLVLPDGVDLEAAIALPAYQVAWGMLHDAADPRRRKTAYINGAAGNIGTAMIHLCRDIGIEIIAGASSEEKCAFARSQGASHTVNTSEGSHVAQILELTKGRGVEVMFDHVVGPNFRDNIKAMAPLGQIITFNALGGFPSSDMFADLRANLDRSVSLRPYSVHVYDPFPEERRRIANEVLKLFASGRIKPAITKRFKLEQAAEAHALMDGGEILGKMIMTVASAAA